MAKTSLLTGWLLLKWVSGSRPTARVGLSNPGLMTGELQA